MSYLGNTYVLKDVSAQDSQGADIKLNGEFLVEDYQPYEPAAGIISSYYTLFPKGQYEDDDLAVTVDPYALEEAIDPERLIKEREQEEEWEQAAHEADSDIEGLNV